ncbi:MAG: NfeD family protein [Oscillatoriophycideae cyanobacterium NC_groundwater_1537_Pr4_S-0.65um_50_18]|nr:NfeD family protein [Oscillatoriophycideae cyanobacterium NC_groundwater_1537_Pr4_S-0.65um_50_18]
METQALALSNIHILWLVGGFIFLGLGLVIGEPVAAALGIAAIITAIAALSVPSVLTQLLIWGVLSIALSVVLRGMVPKKSKDLRSNIDAIVSETIPKGGLGVVSFEGAIWKARCQISDITVTPGQTVHVVGRQGNTLLVMPTTFADEPVDS